MSLNFIHRKKEREGRREKKYKKEKKVLKEKEEIVTSFGQKCQNCIWYYWYVCSVLWNTSLFPPLFFSLHISLMLECSLSLSRSILNVVYSVSKYYNILCSAHCFKSWRYSGRQKLTWFLLFCVYLVISIFRVIVNLKTWLLLPSNYVSILYTLLIAILAGNICLLTLC